MTGCKAACPWCKLDVWWESASEHERHVRMCEAIEKGRLEEEIRAIELPEELLPEVEKKPKGYGWWPGNREPG